jgi:hypothetical protein
MRGVIEKQNSNKTRDLPIKLKEYATRIEL